MQTLRPSAAPGVLACLVACLVHHPCANGTGVPIDGFLPLVGISLNRDFDDDLSFFPVAKSQMTEPQLGAGGVPHYGIALVDTGAAVSLLNTPSRFTFGIDEPYPGTGGSDGFRGMNTIEIGGASGFVDGEILDLLGLYAAGLQTRTANTGPLAMNPNVMEGQTNTSMVVVPPESDLPNVLGFSFLGQYATRIGSDQPQLFSVDGQTVRSPTVEFFERGSGGMGITRKANFTISGATPLTPQHAINFFDPDVLEQPYNDPIGPTFVSGGLFLNVSVSDDVGGNGGTLANQQFFFDTGASVTVVSEANANALGFDSQLDTPDFTIAVVGAGGTTLDVPGFFADSFTIHVSTGGAITATNVPIIVLDIADPADPNNVIGGFVGTNLLAGRNLMIDPNPASAPGPSAGLYISDPVTTNANWSSPAASAVWDVALNWGNFQEPHIKTIANLRHVTGAAQKATIASTNAVAWEVNVSGQSITQTMTLEVISGARLTTFSGLNIEPFGIVTLSGGTLDVQYVDIRNGGRLTGSGSIFTGSGPIPGQVENYSGSVAPGFEGPGVLNVEGRYTNGPHAVLEIQIFGPFVDSQYDRLNVTGDVALAGVLDVTRSVSFTPLIGDEFTILTATGVISGAFELVNLPALPADRMWTVAYSEDAVTLKVAKPGDFDANGAVNAADLEAWSAGFGSSYGGNGFLLWQRSLGAAGGAATVPEPAAASLLGIGLAAVAFRERRRRG